MATPLVVGVDISSKSIALVARHPVTPTAAVVKYPLTNGKDAYKPEHAAEALAAMYEYVDSIAPMAIPGARRVAWIEAPVVAGARNIQSTIKQSYINGIVQAVFVQAGFEVYHVAVSTWKMVVCGNGRADKSVVGSTIRAKWPVVHNGCNGDQDLHDAAAICLYGGEVEQQRDRTNA